MEVKFVNFRPERPLEVLYNLLYGGDGSAFTVEVKGVKDNDNVGDLNGNGNLHRCNGSNSSAVGTGVQERTVKR